RNAVYVDIADRIIDDWQERFAIARYDAFLFPSVHDKIVSSSMLNAIVGSFKPQVTEAIKERKFVITRLQIGAAVSSGYECNRCFHKVAHVALVEKNSRCIEIGRASCRED